MEGFCGKAKNLIHNLLFWSGISVRKPLEVKIKFEGQVHQVDLDLLLTSLLHFSEMVQLVTEKVSPQQKLNIKISAPEKGSFEITLHLAESAVTTIGDLFREPRATIDSVANVVAIIVGVMELKRFLKGRKPDNIEERPDGRINVSKDDVTAVVNRYVYAFYSKNQDINDRLERMFDGLTENPEIEGFLIDSPGIGEFQVDSADFPSMAFPNELLETNEEVIIKENVDLSVLKLVFKRNRKWEFIYNGMKISAYIVDDDFWARVDRGESFRKGDIIKADLEISRVFDEEVNTYVNMRYRVIKVYFSGEGDVPEQPYSNVKEYLTTLY